MGITQKNIIANYIGRIWSFVSIYFFIPLYIKYLGIESYAIINFYSVLMTILFVADAGFSSTLNREMARSSDQNYLANALRTIEYIYWGIALLIFLFVFVCADYIALKWLNMDIKMLELNNIPLLIRIMGGSISFQLIINLYCNGLLGLQRQVLSNCIQILNGIIRSGVVVILLLFLPTLMTYFIWQLIFNIIFAFVARYKLWSFINPTKSYRFDISIIKKLWGFTLGLMGMSIISALNTQIDKLTVSKLLPLKIYGEYALAGIFGQIASILTLPVAIAILPQMTKMVENSDHRTLASIFHRYSFIITSIAGSITMVLFLYTSDFIFIWTKDEVIANNIKIISRILLLGGLFLSLQYMPYYLALANGHTRTNLKLGIVIVVLLFPSLLFFIKRYGMLGAGIPWLILNVVATGYLGYALIKQFLPHNIKKWFLIDILIPIFTTILIGIGGFLFLKSKNNEYYSILHGAFLGISNILICSTLYLKIYTNKSIKQFLINYCRKK